MTSAESAIRDWLRTRGADVEAIDLDYDLVEHRVIDSLHFMEFVLLVEQFTGRDILADGVTVDRFRTMRAIRDNFLVADESVEEEIAF